MPVGLIGTQAFLGCLTSGGRVTGNEQAAKEFGSMPESRSFQWESPSLAVFTTEATHHSRHLPTRCDSVFSQRSFTRPSLQCNSLEKHLCTLSALAVARVCRRQTWTSAWTLLLFFGTRQQPCCRCSAACRAGIRCISPALQLLRPLNSQTSQLAHCMEQVSAEDVTAKQISGAMTNIIYRCNSALTEEVGLLAKSACPQGSPLVD